MVARESIGLWHWSLERREIGRLFVRYVSSARDGALSCVAREAVVCRERERPTAPSLSSSRAALSTPCRPPPSACASAALRSL